MEVYYHGRMHELYEGNDILLINNNMSWRGMIGKVSKYHPDRSIRLEPLFRIERNLGLTETNGCAYSLECPPSDTHLYIGLPYIHSRLVQVVGRKTAVDELLRDYVDAISS